MHKSRLGVIIIDCRTDDLQREADFWSQALGYAVKRDPESPTYIELDGPDGEMRVLLQSVDHEPRVHLDIETDDQAAEVARLKALGAKQVGVHPRWTILEAPSGHRFCIVGRQRPDFDTNATRWD